MTLPPPAAGIVELIGNPRLGSRTRALADAVVTGLGELLASAGAGPTGVRVLELAEVVAVAFGPEPVRPLRPVADPHGIVRAARLLVVATPTYKGTFSGLLKVFLDRYGHRELAGIVAVPVAIAAIAAHRDSVAAALLDLLVELGATVPVAPFAVLESDLDDPAALAAGWVARHGRAIVDALR
jgi:FMN reductase